MSKPSFFAELKRRNVIRAAALYAAGAWLLVQVITQIGPYFHVPEWSVRWVIVAAAIGFPLWLAFAWYFEFTPDGLKRESEIDPAESITAHTGRKLDFIIIGVMAVAIVLLLTDRFVLRHGVNEGAATAASATSGAGNPAPIPTIEADPSIAVLPMLNMSDDKANEYFSDGISEELLNLLAKFPKLRVIARTSSFSFKGTNKPVSEIARTLNVAAVLEGSVRKSNDKVRITVQLIRAIDGTHLWSETYDRKLDDIFAIQDEIAADVVKQLKVTLLGSAQKVRTTDPEAYALYLQAVQLGRQNTAEAFQQSDALLRKVLEIDPRYAPAWVELARNFGNEVNLGVLPSKAGFAESRKAAMKALEIDPDCAPAYARLGWVAMNGDNDLTGAAQHFKRALALDPSDLNVLRNSAALLGSLGRLDEAVALNAALVRRDPVNMTTLHNLGIHQRFVGRYDAAIASFRTLLSLNPGQGGARAELGNALLLKGDAQGALAEIEQEKSVLGRIGLPMAYHALGRKAESDAALKELIAKDAADFAYNIAYVHAFRGEADQAFEWLGKAVESGDSGLGEIVAENLFANIHADPRWLPFLRKLGNAPEQLAMIEFKVTLPE